MISINHQEYIEKARDSYWRFFFNLSKRIRLNIANEMSKYAKQLELEQIPSINNFLCRYLKGDDLCIEEIIFAPLQDIFKMVKKLPAENVGNSKTGMIRYYNFLHCKKMHYLGTVTAAEELARNLHIDVCPYCNRNYINQKKGTTLDHFFPKSLYPLVAISFYNLIPSCYSCNTFKSNTDIEIPNPYQIDNDNPPFTFIAILDKLLNTKLVVEYHNRSYQSGYEFLGIEKVYIDDKAYLLDFINKTRFLSENYAACINSILGEQKVFSLSGNEIKAAILGRGFFSDSYNSVPYHKISRDLYKELIDTF